MTRAQPTHGEPRLVAGRWPASVSWRLALWYAAVFLAIGLFMPYWPPLLESRGLDAGEIGLVLAITTWTKVAATPVATGVADRLGRRRPALIALSCGAVAAFCFYATADRFATLALAAAALGLCFPPLLPLGENLTVLTARLRRLDYGRIRLWGSLAFIAGAWGGGAAIGDDPERVAPLAVGAAALVALASAAAPDVRVRRAAGSFAGLGALLRQRTFLAFLAASGLIQASHAVYYAFATLHWRAAGHDAFTVGALWAEAVAAEVVLFALAGRFARRVGPAALLAFAALAGAVRWATLGATAALPLLIAAQALHAASFGAAHLAAMLYIQRAVPLERSATAQGAYSTVAMGAAMALATMAAGGIYAVSPAGAFGAMAAMCALGAAVAPALSRRTKRQPQ